MYRWKKRLEAVQLPGDLSAGVEAGGLNAKKGNWLVFEDGQYIGVFPDTEWKESIEIVPTPRKRQAVPVEEKPKRGRPRGMKSLLTVDDGRMPVKRVGGHLPPGDGQTDQADQSEP